MAVEAARQNSASYRVSDSGSWSLSEADLSRLWVGQTFPSAALTTAEGERLRVIYRGRRGGGPGPDFRDALIGAAGGLLRGDVELHVRSSDFHRHGHHRDPAYAGVVLHLVFWDDERHPTSLPGGGTAPVAALAGWVEGRAAEIARWLERPALWREPCFSALRRDGAAEVAATLDRLGDIRFRRKTAALAAKNAGGDENEGLWQALLEALAFGPDREAFRLLAKQVRWASLRRRLLTLPASERPADALRSLDAAFAGLPVARSWTSRRPANSPARRLQGAARLSARFAEKGLVGTFVGAFEEYSLQLEPQEAKTEMTKTEGESSLGSARLRGSNFEFRARQRRRSESLLVGSLTAAFTVPGLIGRGRALEIVANAVLPWLAALGPEQRVRRAEAVYACLPVPARYGAVRHLHDAVGTVPMSFRRQQGMLYLLDQYCTQGGCGRCPLS